MIQKTILTKCFCACHDLFGQHFGAQDAAALPNQKFIADSLYRSSYSSPSKRKEETGETDKLDHKLEFCLLLLPILAIWSCDPVEN